MRDLEVTFDLNIAQLSLYDDIQEPPQKLTESSSSPSPSINELKESVPSSSSSVSQVTEADPDNKKAGKDDQNLTKTGIKNTYGFILSLNELRARDETKNKQNQPSQLQPPLQSKIVLKFLTNNLFIRNQWIDKFYSIGFRCTQLLMLNRTQLFLSRANDKIQLPRFETPAATVRSWKKDAAIKGSIYALSRGMDTLTGGLATPMIKARAQQLLYNNLYIDNNPNKPNLSDIPDNCDGMM